MSFHRCDCEKGVKSSSRQRGGGVVGSALISSVLQASAVAGVGGINGVVMDTGGSMAGSSTGRLASDVVGVSGCLSTPFGAPRAPFEVAEEPAQGEGALEATGSVMGGAAGGESANGRLEAPPGRELWLGVALGWCAGSFRVWVLP